MEVRNYNTNKLTLSFNCTYPWDDTCKVILCLIFVYNLVWIGLIMFIIDLSFFVIISLTVWLEVFSIRITACYNYSILILISQNIQDPQGTITCKSYVQSIFTRYLFKSGDIFSIHCRSLDSHSIRHFVSSHVCRYGETKDEKDYRER